MSEPIRVTVADDHTLFREGLRALLESVDGLTMVGTASTGEEAVELAVTARPDVLLMDIRMPGHGGLAAIGRIRTLAPDVAVVMLTMVDDADSIATAIAEGAHGYVLKDAEQDEMLRAIRAAARGELLFGPSVAERARRLLQAGTRSPELPFPKLSERERAVLDLLAAGYEAARIAGTLHLSRQDCAQLSDPAAAAARRRGSGRCDQGRARSRSGSAALLAPGPLRSCAMA